MAKSYLIVWFSSEGKSPSEVTQRLLGLGFRPTRGNYDYTYEWSKQPTIDEIIRLADSVQATLKGMGVTFKIESV